MLSRMILAASVLALLLAGCSQAPTSEPTAEPTTVNVSAPSSDNALLLKSEPAKSQTVIAARKEAKDGDPIVVTGRIGGDVDPWIEGRAAFSIVDQTLIPCNERPGDDCKTPWDYCCDTDRLPTSRATVKFVDDEGKTLATDARKLLGVKELQTVVITGKAKRDEAGNLTVLATGLYVKPGTKK